MAQILGVMTLTKLVDGNQTGVPMLNSYFIQSVKQR